MPIKTSKIAMKLCSTYSILCGKLRDSQPFTTFIQPKLSVVFFFLLQSSKKRVEETSPLWVASKRGHVDVVKALLKASADPKRQNCEKRSPLWVASYWGHVKVGRKQ